MARQARNIPVNTPGRWGINRQEENAILPLNYCVRAKNSVIDSAGRIAIRNGWQNQTSTPIAGSPAVRNVHRYIDNSLATPAEEDIVVWDGGIGNDISNPAGNDISGTLVDAAGDWYLVNFNNLCIGASDGAKLAVYDGTGTFTEIAGSPVTNGIVIATTGRVWTVSENGTTLHYSDLLDHTSFPAENVVDLLSVWGQTDRVTGLAFFNSALIIFAERQIVFYTDGQGSELGIDPTLMYVSDSMENVGCISHWTIQAAGEDDLIFVSDHGITSIGRLIAERSNPTVTLTEKVRDFLTSQLAIQTNKNRLRAAFNDRGGYYVLSIPDASIAFYLSMKHRYQDEMGRLLAPVLEWDLAPTALNIIDGSLYTGNPGLVGRYTGNTDNGSAYDWEFKLPWSDFDQQGLLLIPKVLGAIILTEAQITVSFSWEFDFTGAVRTSQVTTPDIGAAAAEFGEAEWAEAEWGGGAIALFRISTDDVVDEGQYIQLTVSVTSVSAQLAVQTLSLFTKLGRNII